MKFILKIILIMLIVFIDFRVQNTSSFVRYIKFKFWNREISAHFGFKLSREPKCIRRNQLQIQTPLGKWNFVVL